MRAGLLCLLAVTAVNPSFPAGGQTNDAPPTADEPTAAACDRDVQADLLTVADRLEANRLESARAYLDGLLSCAEGRTNPRVFLALAEVDQRLGLLNRAYDWLNEAERMAGASQQAQAEIAEARSRFERRWVRVRLEEGADPEGMLAPRAAGPVVDAVTAVMLAELAAAPGTVPLPSVRWLPPGDYMVGEERVRLAPGSELQWRVGRHPRPSDR
jgi:hypothetical protein